MKKSLIIFTISFSCTMNAIPVLTGLKKARDKMDRALHNPAAVAVKDLVTGNLGKNRVLTVTGDRVVLTAQKSSDARIKAVEEKIETLYWGLQHEKIKNIEALEQTNKEQAKEKLKEIVNKRYPLQKSPIFLLGQEIDREEAKLQEIGQELAQLTLANGVRHDKELTKQVQELQHKVRVIANNLQTLVAMVNRLLMG